MLSILIVTLLLWTNAESHIYAGLGHGHGVTVGITPYSHPVLSQYHAQDVLGQYSYGYATPTSTKSETKTLDGVTQGGYSYIDTNGRLQTVSYVADPINGFRVAASNLPQDLPDVAYAKAQHLAEFAAIKDERARGALLAAHSAPVVQGAVVQDLPEVVRARAEHLAAVQATLAAQQTHHVQLPQVVQDLPEVIKARAEHLAAVENIKARDAAISLSPVHLHGNIVPVHYHVAPSPAVYVAPAAPAPIAPVVYSPVGIRSQYHSQDGWGQYSYGYVGPLSAKTETKGADGVTRGGYSYIDANGILQTVHYIADDVHGFRVAATNLPQH